MTKNASLSVWGITITLLATVAAMGQVFELNRSTIDGGGVMRSTGGDFELSGTIGQPDAGPGASGMSGGDFALTGGFWFAITPGDCNTDGGVNLFDHDAFEPCLTGPDGPAISNDCRCFDLDRSGTIDMRDTAGLQRNFSGP